MSLQFLQISPRHRCALEATDEMCVDQIILEVSVTPKYLASGTSSSIEPSSL